MTALPTMEELAVQAWGEPNHKLSTRDDLRFGRNGSKSVNRKERTWFDHEANEGGGYRDLYKLVHGSYPGNGSDHSGFRVPAGMLREFGQPAAWWDYHDQHEAVVARVVRFEPPGADKTFRQCRPDGDGWKWSTKGLEIPLYRLPALLKSPPGSTAYITEGEKHADLLHGWGLLATTSAGGAKKFAPRRPQGLRPPT